MSQKKQPQKRQQPFTPKFGKVNPLVVEMLMKQMQKLKDQRELLLSADESKMLVQ